MRLSTKGRYSVTAMMDLAIHDKAGPVTLADISQAKEILNFQTRIDFLEGLTKTVEWFKNNRASQ